MAGEDGPERQLVHEGRPDEIWVFQDDKSKRTVAAFEDGKALVSQALKRSCGAALKAD